MPIVGGISGPSSDVRVRPIFQGQDRFLRGFNPDVDTLTVPEDIWTEGGLIQFPSVAGPITFVSDSANDTAGGSGAQSLLFLGVDADFVETLESIPLNGLTPVVTDKDFLFANDVFVGTAGSSEVNEGLITATIGGGLMNAITALAGTSRTCAAILPKADIPGTTPHVISLFAAVGKQPNTLVTFSLFVRSAETGVNFQSLDIPIGSEQGPVTIPITISNILGEGDRVVLRISEATSNDVLVSAVLQVAWLRPG